MAATSANPVAADQVYNVVVGERTSLNQLYQHLRDNLAPRHPHLPTAKPIHRDFRPGDVLHSLADIGQGSRLLGYQPSHKIGQGLEEAMAWYERFLAVKQPSFQDLVVGNE